MIYSKYDNVNDFLLKTESCLEKDEAENNLMLGMCKRMQNDVEAYEGAPFFATVHSLKQINSVHCLPIFKIPFQTVYIKR